MGNTCIIVLLILKIGTLVIIVKNHSKNSHRSRIDHHTHTHTHRYIYIYIYMYAYIYIYI